MLSMMFSLGKYRCSFQSWVVWPASYLNFLSHLLNLLPIMYDYSTYGAGSPITFLNTIDTNMDADMSHSSYFGDNDQLRIPNQPMAYGQRPTGESMTLKLLRIR